MTLKKYTGLQLYQIDQRGKEFEHIEVLNNWKNLDLEIKKKYIKIAKSLKIKPSEINNSIDEFEFLRRYYLSELRKKEFTEKMQKIKEKLLNK
tara:strand:- start:106 stop:384 length:279 start_codon:yes stop_codon:yes gene_type:complete